MTLEANSPGAARGSAAMAQGLFNGIANTPPTIGFGDGGEQPAPLHPAPPSLMVQGSALVPSTPAAPTLADQVRH